MVKTVFACIFTLCLAAPLLAQSGDDYPRIETSFGYANLGMTVGGIFPGRHSGFANISGLNLYPWMGIENYMGYYGLGSGVSLFADTFGARLTARSLGHIVPYVGAGIGAGYFSSGGSYSGSNLSTRVGGGVDIPINELLSWKVDVSRLSIKTGFIPGQSWSSGANITTGIVINIGQ
jgi:hypothetical protein